MATKMSDSEYKKAMTEQFNAMMKDFYGGTDEMNQDEIVAYLKKKCDKNRGLTTCFPMGEHFQSLKGDIVNQLTADGYECKEKYEFFTCPITGNFHMLYVGKVMSEEERKRIQAERDADLF